MPQKQRRKMNQFSTSSSPAAAAAAAAAAGVSAVDWVGKPRPLLEKPAAFAYLSSNVTYKFVVKAFSGTAPTSGVRLSKCKMLADILVGTDRVYDRAFPNTSVMQGHASTGQFPLDAVRACSQAPGFRALPIEVQRRLLDKDINDVFIPEACLRGRITSAFYNANGYAEFPGFYPEGRDHQNVSNGDAVNITHFHHQAAVQAAQQASEEEAAAKAAAEAAKLAEGEALFKAFVLAGGVQNHTVKADTRHGKLVMVLKYLKYKEVTGQNIPRKLTDALPLVEGYVGRAVAARAQRTAVAAAAAAADGEAAAPMVAAADPAGAVAAAAAGAQ
jgi:hypothetical protein